MELKLDFLENTIKSNLNVCIHKHFFTYFYLGTDKKMFFTEDDPSEGSGSDGKQ